MARRRKDRSAYRMEKVELMLKKIVFLLTAAAFFFVPCFREDVRNWAPGLAVLTGIIFSVIWGNPFREKNAKMTSTMLGATIVGMGFGMNLTDILRAGGNGFLYTLIGIVLGLGIGWIAGRLLKESANTAWLVSVGTSICGGSAIAAAAPVLKAKSSEIAMASATVFMLNAIALWIFPVIGHTLGFDQEQFGCWAALGIHDTSSVVGASMAYGERALEVGTIVKLARALWIVPVTLFLSWFVAVPEEDGKRKFKLKVPWFIPGFLAAAALVTWLPDLLPATETAVRTGGDIVKNLSKYLMVVTLFLIGANLNREKLKETGIRPVLQGIILWIVLAGVWCGAIYAGWVNAG